MFLCLDGGKITWIGLREKTNRRKRRVVVSDPSPLVVCVGKTVFVYESKVPGGTGSIKREQEELGRG